MKLLLVDDDRQVTDVTEKLLVREGWTVTVAHSLKEARTKPGPYDIVLADIRLQNGDGRELRADYVTTPFVTISGGHAEVIPDLYKPFTATQLRVALALALESHARPE